MTYGPSPRPSDGRWASFPLPQSLDEAITVMQDSELVAQALGEHVFDFFLRGTGARPLARVPAPGHPV